MQLINLLLPINNLQAPFTRQSHYHPFKHPTPLNIGSVLNLDGGQRKNPSPILIPITRSMEVVKLPQKPKIIAQFQPLAHYPIDVGDIELVDAVISDLHDEHIVVHLEILAVLPDFDVQENIPWNIRPFSEQPHHVILRDVENMLLFGYSEGHYFCLFSVQGLQIDLIFTFCVF